MTTNILKNRVSYLFEEIRRTTRRIMSLEKEIKTLDKRTKVYKKKRVELSKLYKYCQGLGRAADIMQGLY
jgi:predicted RNase H-like nuclease (RuvC/YqgF family)